MLSPNAPPPPKRAPKEKPKLKVHEGLGDDLEEIGDEDIEDIDAELPSSVLAPPYPSAARRKVEADAAASRKRSMSKLEARRKQERDETTELGEEDILESYDDVLTDEDIEEVRPTPPPKPDRELQRLRREEDEERRAHIEELKRKTMVGTAETIPDRDVRMIRPPVAPSERAAQKARAEAMVAGSWARSSEIMRQRREAEKTRPEARERAVAQIEAFKESAENVIRDRSGRISGLKNLPYVSYRDVIAAHEGIMDRLNDEIETARKSHLTEQEFEVLLKQNLAQMDLIRSMREHAGEMWERQEPVEERTIQNLLYDSERPMQPETASEREARSGMEELTYKLDLVQQENAVIRDALDEIANYEQLIVDKVEADQLDLDDLERIEGALAKKREMLELRLQHLESERAMIGSMLSDPASWDVPGQTFRNEIDKNEGVVETQTRMQKENKWRKNSRAYQDAEVAKGEARANIDRIQTVLEDYEGSEEQSENIEQRQNDLEWHAVRLDREIELAELELAQTIDDEKRVKVQYAGKVESADRFERERNIQNWELIYGNLKSSLQDAYVQNNERGAALIQAIMKKVEEAKWTSVDQDDRFDAEERSADVVDLDRQRSTSRSLSEAAE
ncbi:hypothetical protein GF380_01355 [Candidatus Uhrbacteria bacterium]|nr:hypothetical protein [Candidatus Uhrbacteria bacterium]MBD3283929.1 hypothetical protein [Candidatus Uhrbacteria bacterium]